MKRNTSKPGPGSSLSGSFPYHPTSRQLKMPAINNLDASFPDQSSQATGEHDLPVTSRPHLTKRASKKQDPAMSQATLPTSPRRRSSQTCVPSRLEPLPNTTPSPCPDQSGDRVLSTQTPSKLTPVASPELAPLPSQNKHQEQKSGQLLPRSNKAPPASMRNRGGKPTGTVKSSPSRANQKPTIASKKTVLPDISSKLSIGERLLFGYLDDLPPLNSSLVRIFLSSTFSDYKVERDRLVRETYPRLQVFCASLGLDFQVCDLRWGVTEDVSNDHSVEQLCLDEIAQCQRLSRGPTFVAMVGNRNGFQPIPPVIEAEEFEIIWRIAEKKNIKGNTLLAAWYQKDSNALTPEYRLQPISSKIPHYLDFNPDNEGLRKEAVGKWNEAQGTMRTVLRSCVCDAVKEGRLPESAKHHYFTSVTEQEIDSGLLNDPERNGRAILFQRELTGVYDNLQVKLVKRFANVRPNADGSLCKDEESEKLRSNLVQKMGDVLSGENSHRYTVVWNEEGLTPALDASHEEYLTQLCVDFENSVCKLVNDRQKEEERRINEECSVVVKQKIVTKPVANRAVKTNKQVPFGHMMNNTDFVLGHMSVKNVISGHQAAEDAKAQVGVNKVRVGLNAEIKHHLHFCRSKCEMFCGREEELKKVKALITTSKKDKPVVIHAESGSGKTAFMAKVASLCRDWVGKDAVVIMRFLGTSASSSSIRQVLVGLCEHISAAYSLPLIGHKLTKMSKILQCLDQLMMLVSIKAASSQPLVIILDSIDQLSPSDNAHKMQWIPKAVYGGVHFLVSVLPHEHDCLDNAKSYLTDDAHFLELPAMHADIAEEYSDVFLQSHKRTLTDDQRKLLVDHLRKNTQPLLMTLVLDQAVTWNSYTPVSDLQLSASVHEAIVALFERIEKKFGCLFVSKALGYLTSTGVGISEVELEDVLSCSDDVLDVVYKYHDPPVSGIVRIPGLLWSRTRADLSSYIVERQSHGRTTLFWYHRQFTTAALERYCSEEKARSLHSKMADIYLAEKGIKKTIELSQRKTIVENADRQVTLQAMSPKNKRMLVQLPYHLKQAKDTERLKHEVYCKFRYLLCYIEAFSLNELLHDLKDFLEDSEDVDLHLLHDSLRFCQSKIEENVASLGCQLLGQFHCMSDVRPALGSLCEQAEKALADCGKPCFILCAGAMPSSTSKLKWYATCVQRILCHSTDGSLVLVEGTKGKKQAASLTLFNIASSVKGHTLSNPAASDASNTVSLCCFSTDNHRLYMLCQKDFHVYAVNTGERLQVHPTDINHAGHLSLRITVSSDDLYIALGGQERLAMLENKSTSQDETNFQVRHTMNLSGTTATSNLIFNQENTMTLSTHSIKGQKRTIGALVLWDCWNKQLKTRVPLPAPVEPGFMHMLPRLAQHDIVLCGSQNGIISIVDMETTKVIHQMGQEESYISSILSSYTLQYNLLLTATKGQTKIRIWNTDVGNSELVSTISVNKPITSISFSADTSLIAVGHDQGSLSLHQVSLAKDACEEVYTGQTHTGEVLSVLCDDKEQVVTTGEDGFLKIWSIDGILAPEPAGDGKGDDYQLPGLAAETDIKDVQLLHSTLYTGSSTGVKSWSLCGKVVCKDVFSSEPGGKVVGLGERDCVVCIEGETRSLVVHRGTDSTSHLKDEIHMVDVMMVEGSEFRAYGIGEHNDEAILMELDLQQMEVIKTVSLGKKDCSFKLCCTLQGGTLVVALYSSTLTELSALTSPAYTAFCVDLLQGTFIYCHYVDPYALNPEKTQKTVFCASKLDEETVLLGCHGDVMSWQPSRSDQCELVKKEGMKTWLRHTLRCYGKQTKARDALDPTPITALLVSPKHKAIVTGGELGSVIWWRNVPKSAAPDVDHGVLLKGHTGPVRSLLLDGDYLYSGSCDHTVRIWQVSKAAQIASVDCHLTVQRIMLLGRRLITWCVAMDTSRVLAYDLHYPDK